MKDTVTRITFLWVGLGRRVGPVKGVPFSFLWIFFFFWLGQELSHFSVYQVLPKSCADGSFKKKKKRKKNMCAFV